MPGHAATANVTIDGFDNNNPLQALPFQGSLRSTLDSLQEFRVTTTAGGAADAGYSSGAQVTLVTKSGTNDFHGSLYEYNRPTNTVANDYFNKLAETRAGLPNVPGRLLRNTFGGSLGGPILKDKMFFFYTYEGQRQRESAQVIRLVPSANMRNGILTYQSVSGPVTLMPADLAKMDLVVLNFVLAGSSVQESFQRLLSLSVVLQLVPFLYMFCALLRIAFREPFIRGQYGRATLILAGLSGCVTTVGAIGVVFFPAQQIKSLFSYEMWMSGGTLCFVGMAAFLFFVYGRRRRGRKLASPACAL